MFRRSIELVQTLFHDAFRFGGTPEPGGNRPHPAADGGSQSFRIGGHDRHNKTSQDHARPKRKQTPDVLT
jgi:hypothetical protein